MQSVYSCVSSGKTTMWVTLKIKVFLISSFFITRIYQSITRLSCSFCFMSVGFLWLYLGKCKTVTTWHQFRWSKVLQKRRQSCGMNVGFNSRQTKVWNSGSPSAVCPCEWPTLWAPASQHWCGVQRTHSMCLAHSRRCTDGNYNCVT